MAQPQDHISMALFCDFENVALGVRDANYEKFDIKRVLERLLLKGSIVVKKSYCDWERYKGFKAAMHEANFELIEIPHVRQSGKNSADIRLVVDALDLCYTKSHVNTFVIISGDSDFSPLVSKLRENAKYVIGVGVKQSTSDLLIANCDEFIFYDDLVRESQRQRSRDNRGDQQPQQRRSPEEEKRRREEMDIRRTKVVEMAAETYEALVTDRDEGGRVWASVLKEALKRRNPGFSEQYYGFRTFGNLLEEAQSRGLLDLGRDEKSGLFVFRGTGVASRVDSNGAGSLGMSQDAGLAASGSAPMADEMGEAAAGNFGTMAPRALGMDALTEDGDTATAAPGEEAGGGRERSGRGRQRGGRKTAGRTAERTADRTADQPHERPQQDAAAAADTDGDETARPREADRADRADRTDRPERTHRSDRGDRTDRGERAARTDRSDRGDRGDRGDRAERTERTDRAERSDRTAGGTDVVVSDPVADLMADFMADDAANSMADHLANERASNGGGNRSDDRGRGKAAGTAERNGPPASKSGQGSKPAGKRASGKTRAKRDDDAPAETAAERAPAPPPAAAPAPTPAPQSEAVHEAQTPQDADEASPAARPASKKAASRGTSRPRKTAAKKTAG